jgi:hypothetical protein
MNQPYTVRYRVLYPWWKPHYRYRVKILTGCLFHMIWLQPKVIKWCSITDNNATNYGPTVPTFVRNGTIMDGVKALHNARHSVADPDPGSVDFWSLDMGWGLNPDQGWTSQVINWELRNSFWIKKILKFLYADWDPELFWPWIVDEKIRIRDPV